MASEHVSTVIQGVLDGKDCGNGAEETLKVWAVT